jgi:acetyl-CoA C-acetyltransferase
MATGARTLARIPAGHAADLALLTSQDRYPVGLRGRIRTAADDIPEWRSDHA